MIGTQLGPYEIVEQIGRGGMATIYMAYQPSMDRYVAVKVIRPTSVEDETIRERFQREARLIARLEHPYILPVYDFDGIHEPPYIVMRYLEGGTLKEVLANQQLPFGEITYLLGQVGPALDYAHRQGVVHRDVKPSNIMIDAEGNAYVMDFGIARVTQRKSDGDITGAGTMLGTPDYMSPEQIMSIDGIDLRSDVYSLGVMLFQMFTGHLPFDSDAPGVTMMMHLREPVPSAVALNPALPAGFDAIFERAMAKESAERYGSIQALVTDVSQMMGGEVASTPFELRRAALASVELRRERLSANQLLGVKSTSGRSASQIAPPEQNKTITAIYANAAEYAEIVDLSEGPEAAHLAVGDLWRTAASHISEFGGAVFNLSEHDMLALWGSESAREDDPERAVHAALAIRDSMQEGAESILVEEEPLPIRIGVNTGLALLTRSDETGTYTASGATIGLASRVADIADGLVLITKDTLRHVQGVFEILPDAPIRVRRAGGRTLVNTYRVTASKPRAFKLQPRGIGGVDTHMIGRRGELEQLQKAFINAVEDSEAQIVTIVGEPGLGKSRLLFEFASWSELRPELYYIFRGRATPAMSNRPYALWRELLSFRLQILDSDTSEVVQDKMELGIADLIGHNDEIAHLIGHLAGFDFSFSPHVTGEPQAVNEIACRAVSQFFSLLSSNDPVVLQLEDLQHADDASLDLMTELVSSNHNKPLLIVGTARTELFDRRPAWGSGQDFHTSVELRPLDKRDSRDLVSEILQKVNEVPKYLRDLIVERSEGNPYYMEELIKMLIEDRVIQKLDEQNWLIEDTRLDRLRVPPTLVGLLQARFDSLLYPEKLTLQRAAVVGRVFHDNVLRAIDAADQTHVDDLNSILKRLVAREFIYLRETSAFAGSQEFIFAQAMLRDLILETILRRQRSTYYRATAEWLAAQGGERAGEYDGLIAEFYEQAGGLTQAAEYYARAGNAAVVRGALVEAVRMQEKGLTLLDKEEYPAEHLNLLLGLGATYSWMGAYDKAYAQLRPALTVARSLGDRLAEANALAQLGRVAGIWLGDYETGLKDLQEALRIARQIDDLPILIFILRQLGNHGFVTGDHGSASIYLEESLALARKAEVLDDAANALNSLGENARHQGDFESALNYYSQALQVLDQQENPSIRAMVSTNMGFIYVEQSEYDAARRIGEETLEITREIGTEYLVAGCLQIIGGAAVGLGAYDVAGQYLLQALDMFQEMGNMPEVLATIPDCARLQAKNGDLHDAVAWLGMVLAHPALSAFGQLRAEKALDELRANLSEEEVDAAIRLGPDLEIGIVLEQFKTGISQIYGRSQHD